MKKSNNIAVRYFKKGCLNAIINLIFGKGVTDKQFDEFRDIQLSNLVENISTLKMDIDTTDLINKSILITGPRIAKRGDVILQFKKGKDRIIRFNPINVAILHFTKEQVLAYLCSYDLMNEVPTMVSTEEYFYKDIIGASTETSESIYVDDNDQSHKMTSSQSFKLKTSGGVGIEIFLSDPQLVEFWGKGVIPTDFIENAITQIRTIIRTKKSN